MPTTGTLAPSGVSCRTGCAFTRRDASRYRLARFRDLAAPVGEIATLAPALRASIRKPMAVYASSPPPPPAFDGEPREPRLDSALSRAHPASLVSGWTDSVVMELLPVTSVGAAAKLNFAYALVTAAEYH